VPLMLEMMDPSVSLKRPIRSLRPRRQLAIQLSGNSPQIVASRTLIGIDMQTQLSDPCATTGGYGR
jgi:hypothetical protein